MIKKKKKKKIFNCIKGRKKSIKGRGVEKNF